MSERHQAGFEGLSRADAVKHSYSCSNATMLTMRFRSTFTCTLLVLWQYLIISWCAHRTWSSELMRLWQACQAQHSCGRAACPVYFTAPQATQRLNGLSAGDAFVCAFHTAEAAVAWALNTQQVLPLPCCLLGNVVHYQLLLAIPCCRHVPLCCANIRESEVSAGYQKHCHGTRLACHAMPCHASS